MTSTIGIPIKLLNEAQNHVVTLELSSGQVYRGKLIEAEDNMNVQLKDITVTARDGRVSHLDQVYIRGSHVRFFIVPDMLRNAPMFRSRGVRGRGVGMARGRATKNGKTNGEPPKQRTWFKALALGYCSSENLLRAKMKMTKKVVRRVWYFPRSALLRYGPLKEVLLQTQLRETLSTIHKTIAHHRETSNRYTSVENEAILLAIGMPQPLRPLLEMTNDEWEDVCQDKGGWEWVDSEATGKNDFGENVGLVRLKEALEANEWDAGGEVIDGTEAAELEAELGLGNEPSSTQPGMDLEDDTTEMHEAILSHDSDNEGRDAEDDSQIEELETMMLKLQAIREKGAGMSDEERKNLAAKAVRDIMKSI
ncbi:MAG: hypothetical protein Q9174_000909 [Haloplaca sp. 1 TL-2023]